jgi:hypothetical protein
VPVSRAYDYAQTCIGDCGHQCNYWPLVTSIGGGNPKVICDDCTRAAYDIGQQETIWVAVAETKKKSAPRAPRKAAVKKKKVDPLLAFAQELFDA